MTTSLQPQPKVIAFEGGPCGGKTSIINTLTEAMKVADRPFHVLPEAATDYIIELQAAGKTVEELAANDRPAYLSFEKNVLGRIAETITEARRQHVGTHAIIVTDRADIAAYVTESEYQAILADLKLATAPLISDVDTVVYLPTLARANPRRYEQLVGTNKARFERLAQQAVQTCDKNLEMVRMHPDVRMYEETDFATKVGHVVTDVMRMQDALTGNSELQ